MQWKLVFYSVLLVSPLTLCAQGPRVNLNTDGRKIAMNDNDGARRPVAMDSIAPKAMPFVLDGSDKVIKITGSESKKGTVNQSSSNKPNVIQNQNRLDDRLVETNDRFKQVPLAGETDYFGNMNNYMIDYVKGYMSHFGGRLNVVNDRGLSTFETMERVLKSHSIPKELKYLAVIESALNKNARSPVGAVGYWQFMAPTARLMGLTVSGRRDERTDLVKSTHAAAKYLSYLYDQLDDWLLVIAAYNSGPRPVINAMKKTGEDDFWSIKKYLPKETQNHVLAFVATATIMERLNHFLLPGLPSNFDWTSLNVTSASIAKAKKPANPLLSKFTEAEVKQMAIVRIKKPLDLEVVSAMLNIDRRQLGRWNYDYFDYLSEYKTGNLYNFRIPKDKLDVFLEKLGALERASQNMQM
ncbi:lytic transglycosylase domain-containing protein [Taibaiella lutea]|nr:lytic transglycosylase domain-containing protein [Taibaiella lutea]